MRFGDKLKHLREKRGISQQELADRFNLSQSIIGYYETNKREPNINTLMNFAHFFDVTVDYLIGYSDKSKGQVKIKIPVFKKNDGISKDFLLDLNDIKYICNSKKHIELYVSKKEKYYSSYPFESLGNLLQDYGFINVDSGNIINVKHISDLDESKYQINLGDGENAVVVSVSRAGLHFLKKEIASI